MSATWLATRSLWRREVVRFLRQRSRVMGALVTPLVFWLLLGTGLGASFRPAAAPGDLGYLEYFFPGILMLVVMFTAIFSTISIIQDREAGFLQGVLASPAPRSSIVLGKVLGGATLAVLQAALFLLVAPFVGVRCSLVQLPGFLATLALAAVALTAFGFCLAWPMRSVQGFHGVMNLVLMPMWMLSGAFFPATGAPAPLAWAMALNPLTYAMGAARRAFGGPGASLPDLPPMGLSLAATAAFALACVALATHLARREAHGGGGR